MLRYVTNESKITLNDGNAYRNTMVCDTLYISKKNTLTLPLSHEIVIHLQQ